jgi:uncharacterized membrane protein
VVGGELGVDVTVVVGRVRVVSTLLVLEREEDEGRKERLALVKGMDREEESVGPVVDCEASDVVADGVDVVIVVVILVASVVVVGGGDAVVATVSNAAAEEVIAVVVSMVSEDSPEAVIVTATIVVAVVVVAFVVVAGKVEPVRVTVVPVDPSRRVGSAVSVDVEIISSVDEDSCNVGRSVAVVFWKT